MYEKISIMIYWFDFLLVIAPLLFENHSRDTRAPLNLIRRVRSPISFLASFTRLIVYLFLVLSTIVFSCFYLRTILTFLDRKIYSQLFRENRLSKRERILLRLQRD